MVELKSFKMIVLIEGISLLLLLVLAIPLNYLFNLDGPLFFIGMAHGTLFLFYAITTITITHKQKWPISSGVLVFIAGMVPFGFIYVDKFIKHQNHSHTFKHAGSVEESYVYSRMGKQE